MAACSCDDLVLGSSPVSVLEAISLARQGRRVVIAEAASDIGGVWAPVRLGGQTFADQAPHIIDPRPGAYEFLADQLGLKLVDVTTGGFVAFSKPLFGSRLYPYTEYWLHKMCHPDNERVYRSWSDAGLEPGTLKARVQEMLERDGNVEERQSVVKYFEGGTSAFVERLCDLLKRHGVQVLMNCRISNLAYDNVASRWIGLASGFEVAADSVVINGHAFPDTVMWDGNATSLGGAERHTITLFLTLENTANIFLYALFPESPLIHLAADAARGVDCGQTERVIAVTVHNQGFVQYETPEAMCLDVIDELRTTGLISWSSRVASIDVHAVKRARLSDTAIECITQIPGLRFVESRGGLDFSLAALGSSASELAA